MREQDYESVLRAALAHFTEGASLVRGLLAQRGCVVTHKTLDRSVQNGLKAFFLAWYDEFGSAPVTGREVVAALKPQLKLLSWDKKMAVGHTLRRYKGQVAGGLRLSRGVRHAAGYLWRVELVPELNKSGLESESLELDDGLGAENL